MAKCDLREWAVKGAEQRLVELAEEARTIFTAFPELRGRGRGFEVSRDEGEPPGYAEAQRSMSAAARRKVASLRRSDGPNGGRSRRKPTEGGQTPWDRPSGHSKKK